MIRAVFQDGVVYPTQPVPAGWQNGQELRIQGPPETVREEFERLAEEWRADTQFASSPSDVAMHPAYQRIIGMGSEVVGMILDALRTDPRLWFWALRAITGEDPVPAGARGNVHEMAEAWIRWGQERGLVAADVPRE